MERRNSSDCLISRRNRYSAKKRKVEKHEIPSANARGLSGWIDNSFSNGAYHLESEHSVAELQLPAGHNKLGDADSGSDLNNSDIWLAEVNLSTGTGGQPHAGDLSLSVSLQEDDATKDEQPVATSAVSTSEFIREKECQDRLENTPLVSLPDIANSHTPSTSVCAQQSRKASQSHCQDSHSQAKFDLLLKQCIGKASSPVQNTSLNLLKTCSPLPNYRQPAGSIGDILDFSGEADLFEDSLTERLPQAVFFLAEPHAEHVNSKTAENLTSHTHCLPVREEALLENVQDVNKSACDHDWATLLRKEHGQTETDGQECNRKVTVYPQSENRLIRSGTKPPQAPAVNTAQTRGSFLKDKLKHRLLQNASSVTPGNNLEELRMESLLRARLEASQIRREGLVDGIGPFYGLPSKVQQLLSTNRKITKLYDWQDECLKLPAVYEGGNLIYTLPTSGGKTLVAEILILRQILCRQKDALLVLPYISIVQEKVRILSEFATELGFLVEEYAGSKGRFPPTKRRQKHSLFVATIEKGQSLVNSLVEAGRLEEVGLVVVDELHMIGEGGSRGAAMESTLLKVLNATKEPPQVIGMSATLNNISDLAEFLNADMYTSDFRPVSLREYVKVEDNLYMVDTKALVPEDRLQHERILTFPHSDKNGQMDPEHLLPLVLEIVPDNSCLLFCPTKRYCENVALMLARLMRQHHRHLSNVQKEKRQALLQELQTDGGGKLCPTLRYTVQFGLAYHHSGLTTDERRLIEDAYSDGVLCLLTCTSTLAAGVNLPAKRVILRSPFVGADFIKHSQYKQMTGRAGRAGIDCSGESILIAKKTDMPKVVELLSGPQDMCHSSLLYQSGKGLRTLILSLIGLKLVETTEAVFQIMQKTLLAVQAATLGVDIITAIRQAVQELLDQGLVVQRRVLQQSEPEDVLAVADKGSDTFQKRSSCALKEKMDHAEDTAHTMRVDGVGECRDVVGETGSQRCKRMQRDGEAIPCGTSETTLGSDGLSGLPESESQDSCHASPRDLKLDVTELGRATFKGSVDIDCGCRLYQDLKDGEQSLVVANHLHLLYLVTPYDLARDVTPSWMIYMHQLSTLAADELKVASLIGVPESFVVMKASGQSTRQKVDMAVVQRFYLTLMLHELWKQYTVWDVAERFEVPRGFIQNLLSSAASFASCVLRFCQELPEFWAYQDLLGNFGKRLAYCVTVELIPLMEVPGVKLGRARQLYNAGYQTLQSLASADPAHLVSSVQFLTHKAARQIISAAKVLVEEKTDALLEQVEQLVPLPLPSAPSLPKNPVKTVNP